MVLLLFNTSFSSIDATIAITFTDGIYLEILQSVPSIRSPNVLRWMPTRMPTVKYFTVFIFRVQILYRRYDG